MPLTVGHYLTPTMARPVAIAAIAALTAINLGGVHKTARATALFLTCTLVVLAIVVAASAALLEAVVAARGWGWAEPIVRVGAGIAAAGVLLSLIAGAAVLGVGAIGFALRHRHRRSLPRD